MRSGGSENSKYLKTALGGKALRGIVHCLLAGFSSSPNDITIQLPNI